MAGLMTGPSTIETGVTCPSIHWTSRTTSCGRKTWKWMLKSVSRSRVASPMAWSVMAWCTNTA